MDNVPEIHCDLLVIGSGMTGMAAALFAANREIDTVQVGLAGELGFASGFLDLLGVHPTEEGRVWDRPWDGIDALVKSRPRHPYALLNKKDMRASLSDFISFLAANGLPYHIDPDRNLKMITPAGTIKTTYAVPVMVKNGVRAVAKKSSCLIVDFHGLKGFSGRQIVDSLKKTMPNLITRRISFPDATGELFPEQMAFAIEQPERRAQLAAAIIPHLDRVRYVGLPAILGLYRPMMVFDDLQRQLDRPLFEIPTMPPSINGLRLKNIFGQALPRRGVRTYYQHKILSAGYRDSYGFRFGVGREQPMLTIFSKGAILASGRFIGGGLAADRKQVRETIFGLPVHQTPAHLTGDRSGWHRKSFLDPKGHPINRFGLVTDHELRPLGNNGKPTYPNLFAAGSILAHQDWVREKSGAGLAITTAHASVKAWCRLNGR
ncbi:MAG: glycerol-3-phosphate dehydrogenase subunit GlpB [Thermodesulfobacteriota bacterium]|nr:glycerol-3-phosphate dehydrogenase subunit GlpB [Thermodesulfobacteriota bacterium]